MCHLLALRRVTRESWGYPQLIWMTLTFSLPLPVASPECTSRRQFSLRRIHDGLKQLYSWCLPNISNCKTDCVSLCLNNREFGQICDHCGQMCHAKHLIYVLMGESCKHYAKWKKLVAKDHILYNYLYVKYPE